MRPTNSTETSVRTPVRTGSRTDARGPRQQRPVSPHSNKFVGTTSALIIIAIVALAAAYVIWHNDKHAGPPPPWSEFKPDNGGNQGQVEIANHVAPEYRISGTQQIDAITVLNVANPDTIESSSTGTPPNQYEVAVGHEPGSGSTTVPVSLLGGQTVAYEMCGLGANCNIGEQIPSDERELLLRREGLELALYTLHYEKHINNVAIIFPPATTSTSDTSTLTASLPSSSSATKSKTTKPLQLAMLFDRQQLKPWVDARTFSSTLSPLPPSLAELPDWVQTEEGALVSQLTAEGLFTDQFEREGDGSSLLVFNPEPPQ